jgi:hypothetical protein
MIGASGVGKTSTLTAMYQQFNKFIGNTLDIQLIPDDATSNRLTRKLTDLKKQIETESVRTYPTVEGTNSVDEFNFILAKDEDSPEKIRLKFRDFPGGYIETERKEVKKWIKESQVILIPIDTPAMLEEDGKYNEIVNSPAKLYDIFKSIRGSFETRNHLVLFVPLKSEKYLIGNDYYQNNIVYSVEKYYSDLINLFSSDLLKDKVSIAITTIQTIGGIKFSMMEEFDDEPVFIYKKKGYSSTYEPVDTDQPLRYILIFAIAEFIRNRGKVNATISDFFGLDQHFIEGMRIFTKNHKKDHNFSILQGEELLKL